MSHDKRALQKQAQETFIYLAGNIRLGVKMSSSTTTRQGREEEEKNKKRLVELIRETRALSELDRASRDTTRRLTEDGNKLTVLLNLVNKEERRLDGVPKRNERKVV